MKQKHMWLKSKQRCSHPKSRGCGWGMLKQNIHFRTWQSLAICDSAVWGKTHPKTFAIASCIKICFYVPSISSQWRPKQDGNKWKWSWRDFSWLLNASQSATNLLYRTGCTWPVNSWPWNWRKLKSAECWKDNSSPTLHQTESRLVIKGFLFVGAPDHKSSRNWYCARLHSIWNPVTWLAYPIGSVATTELPESVLLAVSTAPKGILLLSKWHCIRIYHITITVYHWQPVIQYNLRQTWELLTAPLSEFANVCSWFIWVRST